MLTYQQLVEYYAKKNELVSPRMALIEYLQYELLDSLYKQKGSEQLSFMGGTAIRIGYHGNRFSEDLDFDNFGLSFSMFQTMLGEVARDMRSKGFVVEFRFIEKGAYHCYVKFPHLLHEHKLSEHESEKILIKVETMPRERLFVPKTFTINQFDLYRDILLNSADILLAQKLITILQRKRTKGRDFYDVSFLYGITQPNIKYIEQSVKIKWSAFAKQMLDKCGQLDFKDLAKEVRPFLIKEDQIERVIGFKKFIIQKLSEKYEL